MKSRVCGNRDFGIATTEQRVQTFAPFIWSICLHAVAIVAALALFRTYHEATTCEVFLASERPAQHAGHVPENTDYRRSRETSSPRNSLQSVPKRSLDMAAREAVSPAITSDASPHASEASRMPDPASGSIFAGSSMSVIRQSSGAAEKVIPAIVEFGSSNGPAFLECAAPVYPQAARQLGKEGKVVLRLSIDEFGSLQRIEVVDDPGYGFADAARDAVRKSRFRPARQDGRNIPVLAILPVKFVLGTGRK